MQTLSRDVERREKQAAKAITRLTETSGRLEDTERHKSIVMQQLTDITGKYERTCADLDRSLMELRYAQLAVEAGERKREEGRILSQEPLRQ